MYENVFNLTGKPFQLRPDPEFFFNSSTHRRALSYLRYGLEQGEGFIVITGDVGTGKSTLVATLFRSLDKNNVVAAKFANTMLEPVDLLQVVAAQFELPYENVSKAEMLQNLEVYFRSCIQEGKRVLLVVDEAQNLPPSSVEELRMLSNFEWEGRPLLQTFLLGQREFRITMRSHGFEQLRQRVIAAYHLNRLSADESRAYIEHRLEHVGWKGDPSISPEVFEGIYEFSQGVPRKTNVFCDRLMLFAALEELHDIDKDALDEVLSDVKEEFWQSDDTLQGHAFPAAGHPRLEDNANNQLVSQSLAGPSSGEANLSGSIPSNGGANQLMQNQQENRMSSVEQSVVGLADTLKQELSLMREAMLEEVRAGKQKRVTRKKRTVRKKVTSKKSEASENAVQENNSADGVLIADTDMEKDESVDTVAAIVHSDQAEKNETLEKWKRLGKGLDSNEK